MAYMQKKIVVLQGKNSELAQNHLVDTAENTNTDLKFRRVIESIKTNTNYNTLTGLQLLFF